MINFDINSAIYVGDNNSKDVTNIVKNILNINKILTVSNKIFGDIEHGVRKRLIINESFEFFENELVFFKNPCRDVGIYYTNNNISNQIIDKTLSTIYKNYNNDIDIISSVWNPIPNNPFIQLISEYKVMSHINICLQILQCLHMANKINKNYDYVYFLEHDVLYPKNYFNLDKRESNIYCNTNYIGLNENGYQSLDRVDKPLSQMCMKFEFAINHFENILLSFIKDIDSVNIEPNIKNITLIYNDLPSVHINHDKPFTSHFDVYGKVFTQNHFYWGDSKLYY